MVETNEEYELACVDFARQYYGVWNGATRTFVLSSELFLLGGTRGSAQHQRNEKEEMEYQRRWLRFCLHLALLTAEQTFLILDDPILSSNIRLGQLFNDRR